MAINLTDGNFKAEVLDAEKAVIVDFWAPWCGMCKAIMPMFDELAAEMGGQAIFGKVDVDEAREIAVRYSVRSIPMMLFFKNGEVKHQIIGANITKEMLKKKLAELA